MQFLTVQETVLIGKDPAAAGKLIASIVAASASQAGLSVALQAARDPLAASLGVPTAGGSVVRAKAIKAGDGAAEIVFHFVAPEGDFQGGEVFVRVGGTLSRRHLRHRRARPGGQPGAPLRAERRRRGSSSRLELLQQPEDAAHDLALQLLARRSS